MMPRFLLLTLFMGLFGSANTLAEIYRWVDENGKIQFSDRPIKGKVSHQVEFDNTKNSYGGGTVLNRQRELLNSYQAKDRQLEKDRQQTERKENQLKMACVKAKDTLLNFERSSIYRLNDQGERIYYSEKKRADRIEEIRRSINKNCN